MRLGSFLSATGHVAVVAGILWFGLAPEATPLEDGVPVLLVSLPSGPSGAAASTGDAGASAPAAAPNDGVAPPASSTPIEPPPIAPRSTAGPRESPPEANPSETQAVEIAPEPAAPPPPTPTHKPEPVSPDLAQAEPTVQPPPESTPSDTPEPASEPGTEPAAAAAEASTAPESAAAPGSGEAVEVAAGGTELAALGGATTSDPVVSADYAALLAAWLERYKRYPDAARRKYQEGTVLCEFVIDASGRVLSRRIVEGSGYALLDAAADELFERADPVPPPPDGAALTYVVPIVFALR